MPCPFFEPREPLEWSAWPGKYRPPLGRPYDGLCRAVAGQPHKPDRGHAIRCCNLGYARGACDRLPEDSADAVRFSLTRGGGLLWVVEKSHLPLAHGSLAHGQASGRGELLDLQIAARLRAAREANGE